MALALTADKVCLNKYMMMYISIHVAHYYCIDCNLVPCILRRRIVRSTIFSRRIKHRSPEAHKRPIYQACQRGIFIALNDL